MADQISKSNDTNTGGRTNQIKPNGGSGKKKEREIKSNPGPAKSNETKYEHRQIKSYRGRPFGCSLTQEQELKTLDQQESVVLEDVDTDDEWVDDMDSICKSSLDIETGSWQGDEMNRTGGEDGTIGTIGFFNVDGLQVDGTAMEELALEAERTNCMIMGVCDHR